MYAQELVNKCINETIIPVSYASLPHIQSAEERTVIMKTVSNLYGKICF
jgi:hypothetical protein